MTTPSVAAAGVAGLQIAAGSVAGRRHLLAGRGSQDAWAWSRTAHGLVAVVCDGCGSGARSEVGAALGASLVVAQVQRHLERSGGTPPADLLASVGCGVLADLDGIARAMGGERAEVVGEHLLFTIVGAVVTADLALGFALGDGLVAVNGEVHRLGPFADNAPPYLGEALIPGSSRDLALREVASLPAPALRSLVLGSDGAIDLLEARDRRLPGRAEPVGPLARLWEDDRFFANPDALRRHLAVAGRDSLRPDWSRRVIVREPGLLPDDTTVVVLRRPPAVSPSVSS